jgi:hypothetical protein
MSSLASQNGEESSGVRQPGVNSKKCKIKVKATKNLSLSITPVSGIIDKLHSSQFFVNSDSQK